MMTKREELEEQKNTSNKTVRGFRLDDETMDAFKLVSEKIGGNQQHVVAELIKTYENQAQKGLLVSGVETIETFEKYQDMIHDLFMTCMKEKQDAVELAKQDFVKQLNSKDMIIQDLQESLQKKTDELNATKDSVEPLEKDLADARTLNEDNEKIIEKLREDIKTIKEDSATKISNLTHELEEVKDDDKRTRGQYEENVKVVLKLENEIDVLKKQEMPLRDNLSKLTGDNKALTTRNEYLERENDDLNREIESLKASKEAELELARKQAALEMKDEMLKEIDKMRSETDSIRNKYMELLESKSKQ